MLDGWSKGDRFHFALAIANVGYGIGLFFGSDPAHGITFICVGVLFTAMPFVRKAAWNAGWFSGRGQMVASLDEGLRRGLTLNEWLISEAERDYASLPEKWKRRVQEEIKRQW